MDSAGRDNQAQGHGLDRPIDPNLSAPNFFIVGAAKAGTTSLHAYLSQHPQVFMSPIKEPHYFAEFELRPEFDNFEPVIRDPASYQRLFEGSEGFVAIGEGSPSYLGDPFAAARIRAAIPDAKIIITLRNPVQRAYSHYLMEFRQGRERGTFAAALAADQARSEKGWGVSFQYLELGLYCDQVRRYLATFGRSNVLVMLFEDLVRDTPLQMQKVALFLGIDPAKFPSSAFERVHNPFEKSRGPWARRLLRSPSLRRFAKRYVPRSVRAAVRNRLLFVRGEKPQMDQATRQWLQEVYAPDIERLEHLLDRDLGPLKQGI